MATFVDKMLGYLGLKDVEEDEFYDDYEEEQLATSRVVANGYVEHDVEPQTSTLRPLVREETHVEPQRAAVVRPLVPHRSAKPQVVVPARFGDAQEIGDLVKQSSPVIVNLQASDRDLARRMIDFCSGLTYALGGQMERVAEQVFLLTPSNVEVSAEERQRLQERGLYQS